ncbi:MAG: choice-of-anchor J domain-containing protein, partial [Candidatus Cloacimonas acidaminovorans]|nr:choice-of-anchor J domain-containing protein [Candidatus Cloacimonas acidaminovorans]
FSPSNLQYSTTYYWKVDPHNNSGYASEIATLPVWSFTTMADPTIYPPFTEGFENGNTHNTNVFGWTQEGISGSNVWTANNTFTDYNRTPRTGSWNAFLRYSNTRWMFKPIQLEANINYRVIIYARQDATSGASIKISYGATATAAGMTNTIIDNTNITNGEYQRLEGIFTPTASGLYYIGILGTLTYTPNYLSIDDITIEEVPENPVCSVYPESWDFGTVLLGSSATKQFTISNTGGGKLMINSVETTGDYYSIISLPTDTELEAGENTNFTVKYEPGAESKGTHQGSVVIHYGDGGEKLIPLTGTCVDATIYETDLPYTENFDGTWSGNPPAPFGWKVINADNDGYTWNQSNTYISPTHSGTYAAHGMGNANDYLISPPINSSGINIRLKWWDKVESASRPNKYKVLLSTTTPDIASFTIELGDFICTNTSWTEHSLNLTAYSNNIFYLAFYQYYSASTSYGFGIDDFLLEVAPSVVEPSNLTVSNITGNSAVLGWTENNVPPATTWDIIYGAPGFNPNGKATQIQVTSNPYTLTGLQPGTDYQWYVRAVKDGNVSAWVGPSSFTTTQIPAELPFTEDFEGDLNWTIVNGTQTNQWYVGTATYYAGSKSAYISNDNGVSNAYNISNSTSVVHLYRDIAFPAGALEYNLSFMFKCGGESGYDGLKVFLVNTSTIPAAGTQLTTGQIGNTWYNLTTNWTEKTITINNAVAGTTKRLVFSWINDGSGGTQPPAAIDNIELTYTMPNPSPEPPSEPVPDDLATNVPLNQILSWTNNGTVTKVDVYFGPTGNMVLVSENQTNPLNSYDPDLEYGQTYEWKIVAKNDADEAAEGPVWSFTTMKDPTQPLPYTQDFNTSTTFPANWTQSTSQWSIASSHGRTGNGIYKNMWSSATNAWFQTQPIGPITEHTKLSFYYRWATYSYNYPTGSSAFTPGTGDNIKIWVSTDDGANFIQYGEINSSNHTPIFGWTEKSIWLSGMKASAGDRIILKFEANWGSGDWFIDIDDIEVKDVPANPVFSITPESKAFGELQINTVSAPQVFTIKNNGGGTLIINPAVELTGTNADQFQLTDTNSYPCNLGPDQTITVSVAFAPTSLGEKTASLKIVDNLSKTEHNIPLTGTGVDYTIYVPYLNDFQSDINGWTILDVNNDGKKWTLTYEISPNKAMKIVYNSSLVMNDWLITPPISLNKDTAYNIRYEYRVESGDYPENLGVYIGSSPTPEALSTLLNDHHEISNTTFSLGQATFTPQTTGIYYIGFHGYSDADMWNLYVDNFRITFENSDIVSGIASGGNVSIIIPPVHSISPTIDISNLPQSDATVTVIAGYADVDLPNAGLSLTLTGTSFSGAIITINHNLGFVPAQIAYRIEPGTWNLLTSSSPGVSNWNETTVTFTLSGKAAGDLCFVFPQQEGQTLPVTLSNFTAVVTSENFVNIAWMAETETNHSGYNIFRNETKDLENAIKINAQLIDKGTAVGTQISYFYTDFEVYTNMMYYYWLESVALDGSSQFYGPLTVTIGDPAQEPLPPVIPMVTKLYNAFPNPFNPNTNIRYSLKEVGKVKIEIYNMKGQKIKTFTQEHNSPGYYQVSWDGRDENGRSVASGIYLYRLTTANYTSAKKMVLAK